MTLKELLDDWKQTGGISATTLEEAICAIPSLHAVWWERYTDIRAQYRAVDARYKQLHQARWAWYAGKLPDDERLEWQWPPQSLRILNADIPRYLDADKLMQKEALTVVAYEEKLKFVEDVLKQISNRGYLCRTLLDYVKWKTGM